MSTNANDAVNIPKGPTGPHTEAGKAKSSRNAIRTGLYAARDFVRSDEEEEYAQTLIKLMDELTPKGTLEETFATEIMCATWRLRRCRLVEESFSSLDDLNFDPMLDQRTEKQQKSVDRARAQSHLILRRSIAELRKLQTNRTIHEQLADEYIPGLTDVKQVVTALKLRDAADEKPKPAPTPAPATGLGNMDALMALADHQLAQRYRESGLGLFCNPGGLIATEQAAKTKNGGQSFCNPGGLIATEQAAKTKNGGQTPRNAPCPCKSGAKYKRCCGKEASPVLNKAA